ncbi:MAG TPA: PSD1 and planctomycete cytochrome C domain-containing protein [Pirellulaceae bacterium]|nr:PSD1 and planctomycete cytochrome C domain-containing protein [Pirellulaceae bacterium]
MAFWYSSRASGTGSQAPAWEPNARPAPPGQRGGASRSVRSQAGAWERVALALLFALAAHSALGAEPLEFNRDIRPILADNCFRCHGADSAARKADLRLDQRAIAIDSGALTPGQPDNSELLRRILSDDPDEMMPPPETRQALNAEQKTKLRQWIADGATYEEHWSFVPPVKVDPTLRGGKSKKFASRSAAATFKTPHSAIDHFVLDRLSQEGILPSREADRTALIRRLSLDLTGLPPSLAEVDAFVADKSDSAYEDLVEHLLKSNRYGEHMAAYWLDAARYADSNGYQYDTERTMWPWRDWVIQAFNENMPFDQFTIEQLAGDLLPNATTQQRLATGFNRNHPITIEGGVIDEEYRTEYVIDRITTTSTVWMGLTMGCVRCHDHKYDPLTRTDFYSFFAFFNNVPERGNNGFAPQLRAPTPSQQAELDDIARGLAAVEQQLIPFAEQISARQLAWETTARDRVTNQWHVLAPRELKSTGGSTLTVLEDLSVLVGGASPGNDDYELVFADLAADVTAIRLEAITHESLPHGGAGRAFNSNFVLSEFEAHVSSQDDSASPTKVVLASASADYSQQHFEVAQSIDGNLGTGWAVDGPTRKENSTAVYLLDKPLRLSGGSTLQIALRHRYGSTHTIGRFRISVSNDPSFAIPPEASKALATATDNRSGAQRKLLADHFLSHVADGEIGSLGKRMLELQTRQLKLEASFPESLVMTEMATPRDTFMLIRGQYDQTGDKVTAATPEFLPQPPAEAPLNRLTLARWLVSREHPLTARVFVNRLWQQIFGIGIVRTTEDLGTQGEWPSHPELLDWLAVDFVESGWDIKHLVKTIVMSSTYRQVSDVSAEMATRDPENRLLARGPRNRLSAEMIRDNALAVSGLLVEKVGGPSVYPYQPPGLWLEINNRPGYSKEYPTGNGDDLYRRSLYTFWKRTLPHPALAAFDASEREVCLVRRSRTNTPLQALVALNDSQFVEAARHLAERMMAESPPEVDARLTRGFCLTLARPPQSAESAELRRYFDAELEYFRGHPEAAARLLAVGQSPRNQDLDVSQHAAYTSVARLLLNLDETLTKN